MDKKVYWIFSFMIILSFMLGACSTPETTVVSEPTEIPQVEPTETTVEETEPTQEQSDRGAGKLILATTTSTNDSGLLDYILPDFEGETGSEVDVIAVGTGQALSLGENGDADVLLVHARAREDAFMDASHGVRREDVMYNDFVIVGPPDDPAGIQGLESAADAFQAIAEAKAPFVSRGDDSGTNTKEKSVWEAAGIEPEGNWYISAGQGMGAVLTMADEQQAYTLSDRATYLARTLEGTELVIQVEGDPILFNPYGVIAVNPEKNPEIQNELANTFIDWLISVPVQEKIGGFGVEEFGQPLFVPDSQAWRDANVPNFEGSKLILATTTSTNDSGLLDYILPDFESETGAEVDVIAVGTGQALSLGENGDADVLLVHARAREDAFMDADHGVRREDVMYNDFVIVGPPDDPAGIQNMESAAEAFLAIAEAEAPFVSRGDDSGTHTKEKSVWEAAGVEPAGDWYISAGQGMGAVLTMADEQQAYTLSDRATYLARTLEGTELVILVEGDPILFNPYGVIAVNPEKNSEIQNELANAFIDWLISVPVQEKIGGFGVEEFGQPLFVPDSQAWRDAGN